MVTLEAGNPENLPETGALGRAADAFAMNVLIRQMQACGVTTCQTLADAMNTRGIHTARGVFYVD